MPTVTHNTLDASSYKFRFVPAGQVRTKHGVKARAIKPQLPRAAKPAMKPAAPDFLAMVRERMQKTGETRGPAMLAIAREHPAAHARWVDSQCAAAQTRPVRKPHLPGGWMARVRAYADQHKCTLRDALCRCAAESPTEHEEWLRAGTQ